MSEPPGEVYVHGRRVSTDRTFFISLSREEIAAFGCGVCGRPDAAASYFMPFPVDAAAIERGGFSPFAEFFVCSACDTLLAPAPPQIQWGALVQRATGPAFAGAGPDEIQKRLEESKTISGSANATVLSRERSA